MARPYRQAHRIPVTLGDAWDEARDNPRQTARDLAALVLVGAALVAAYIILWGAQS